MLGNDQDGASFLTAVNCSNGEERWRAERRSAVVAYSTPCVFYPPGGRPELIFNSEAHGISAIDPQDGHTKWELSVFDKRSVSSPIVAAGLVFGTCGSGGGGTYIVAVKPGSTPEVAYKITDAAPYVPTLLSKGELLYSWSDKGVVSCLKAATGEKICARASRGQLFRLAGTDRRFPVLHRRRWHGCGSGRLGALSARSSQLVGRRQPQHAGRQQRPDVPANLFAPDQHRRTINANGESGMWNGE